MIGAIKTLSLRKKWAKRLNRVCGPDLSEVAMNYLASNTPYYTQNPLDLYMFLCKYMDKIEENSFAYVWSHPQALLSEIALGFRLPVFRGGVIGQRGVVLHNSPFTKDLSVTPTS